MKVYGIYLAYPPPVDLRAEGLGRLLAEFLKAANRRGDVRFVIACPSWSRKNLQQLLDEAGISPEVFDIIGPETKPVLLGLYDFYKKFTDRKREKRSSRLLTRVKNLFERARALAEHKLATTRSSLILAALVIVALPFTLIGAIIYPVWVFLRLIRTLFGKYQFRSARLRKARLVLSGLKADLPSASGKWRIFQFMENGEAKLISDHANRRKDIRAWYSPAAFWPQFNSIAAPRLICVPDIVLSNFPVSFSSVSGNRFLEVFNSVEKTIEQADHFVTYSDDVKYTTLVHRYHVNPDAVSVVRHGTNRLDELISVSAPSQGIDMQDALCENLFRGALHKAIGNPGAVNFHNGVRFIFYASQFRPNKNVISLLRAYEYLLKRRYIGYKLVLTGNPKDIPEVARFISDHNLQNDVLCLHGLSARELAACYRLADLAVNPSLSEGGCPFTLTEALSVGTPVVMAKIAVTEEVVTDPDMRDLMLFDPYDWKAIADKIEWALQNKELLLERQLPLYNKLAERTWQNVVDEHVAILDRISSEPRQSSSPA